MKEEAMKKLVLTVLLVALCALAASAADISGKWVAQVPGRDGTPMDNTFVFKVDAGKITGTLTMNFGGQAMEQQITDGKLDGDAISFTVVMEFNGNQMKSLYKGTVSGSEMKLTRTREGGAPGGGGGGGGRGGAPQEIVAKKVG
jgi:opacity protein-like surface antigen